MAKRGADKYITDQNWDQEEEEDEEEKGEYATASADVMSKRTVIKAKRRCNTPATEGSNLFQGLSFAGFTKPTGVATATAAADSSASSSNEVQNVSLPTQVTSSDQTAKRLRQSENLSSLNENLLIGLNDLVSKDPACDLTSVLTTYCEHVRSVIHANGYGQSSSVTSVTGSGTPPAAKKPDSTGSSAPPPGSTVPLSELFKKASDTWDCSVCCINNKMADAKCVACTAARPANIVPVAATSSTASSSVVESSTQPSLAELFKKSADEWECKSCWVRNKSSAFECVACNTKNPSASAQGKDSSSATESGNSVTTSAESTAASFKFLPKGGFSFQPPAGSSSVFTFGTSTVGSSSSEERSISSSSLFSFKPKETSNEDNKGATGVTFNFGKPGPGFNFGTGSAPFSNSLLAQGIGSKPAESTSSESKDEDNEEYVPPKTEAVAHTEEGAFYNVRCKLFYQKDGQWIERGLGNLFLKPCGDRTQLIVRTDNSLGNILLNVLLDAKMPVSRQGSNNVSLACVPNPPIDSKQSKQPVCMLIRVKTGEMADELFAKINESKSKQAE